MQNKLTVERVENGILVIVEEYIGTKMYTYKYIFTDWISCANCIKEYILGDLNEENSISFPFKLSSDVVFGGGS